MRAALCVFVCIIAVSFAARADDSVGFRKIKIAQNEFGVWYPANAAPNMRRFGLWEVAYAENAAPVGEKLPLVVLSHGNGGKYRPLHLTASHLAKNGFVVIAPQHKDARDGPPDMHSRVGDVKLAIATMQNSEEFAPLLYADNIHAIGYSLGGATALAAAGVSVNWESFKLHCARNYDADENACEGFPFWARWLLRAKHFFLPKPKIVFWDFSQNPAAFRKIALVAPVGQPMDSESLADLSAEVLILQIEGDTILRAPFHSEHLRDNLSPQRTNYELIPNGYHYGFIAPFPPEIIAQDPELAALIRPDFDHAAFIAKINKKILAFLQK